MIETGHVATLAVIADNALGRAETLARLARALRALIVAGASCNNRRWASLAIVSLFLSPYSSLLSLITNKSLIISERRQLRTLTCRSVEWTTVIAGNTLVAVWSIGQVAARLNAHAAVWKTLTVTIALASYGKRHARSELTFNDITQ